MATEYGVREIVDASGRYTAKYRPTRVGDGKPIGLCTHAHDTPEAAQNSLSAQGQLAFPVTIKLPQAGAVLQQATIRTNDLRWGKGCCPFCGAPAGVVCRRHGCGALKAKPQNRTTEDKLRRALPSAVGTLAVHEPGDSRAVSDELVALASVD